MSGSRSRTHGLYQAIPYHILSYHTALKSGGPSLINGKVIAIFVKCAKFVTEEEKEENKTQFYSFRLA